MDLAQKIIEVSQEFGSICVFCVFTDQIHKNIGCQKNHCYIKYFLEPLKEAIPDPIKDYDSIRNLFIRQTIYLYLFICLSLKLNKARRV